MAPLIAMDQQHLRSAAGGENSMNELVSQIRWLWHPVGEVRRRHLAGTLELKQVFWPAVTATILLSILATNAGDWMSREMLNHPLMVDSGFPEALPPDMRSIDSPDLLDELFSVILVALSVGTLWLVPRGIFKDLSNSNVAATFLLVNAGLQFWATSIVLAFWSGIAILTPLSLLLATLFQVVGSFILLPLVPLATALLYVWALRGVLKMSFMGVAVSLMAWYLPKVVSEIIQLSWLIIKYWDYIMPVYEAVAKEQGW